MNRRLVEGTFVWLQGGGGISTESARLESMSFAGRLCFGSGRSRNGRRKRFAITRGKLRKSGEWLPFGRAFGEAEIGKRKRPRHKAASNFRF